MSEIVKIGKSFYSLGTFTGDRYFNCKRFLDAYGIEQADNKRYVIKQTIQVKKISSKDWNLIYKYSLVNSSG